MEPLRIFWNRNLKGKITPGKLAAHAAHAALAAYGIKYEHPIVVLSAGKGKIEEMPIVIRDAGHTELEPGTVTTGVERPMVIPPTERETRSRLHHMMLASRVLTDPKFTADALSTALAQDNEDNNPIRREFFQKWIELLKGPTSTLVSVMVDDSPESGRLREFSPFFGAVTSADRAALDTVRENFRAEVEVEED